MTTRRHFTAKLGDRIVFRSSATRIYRSVSTSRSSIPVFHMHERGDVPCTEISGLEMKALRDQVAVRMAGNGTRALIGPRDSWLWADEQGAA